MHGRGVRTSRVRPVRQAMQRQRPALWQPRCALLPLAGCCALGCWGGRPAPRRKPIGTEAAARGAGAAAAAAASPLLSATREARSPPGVRGRARVRVRVRIGVRGGVRGRDRVRGRGRGSGGPPMRSEYSGRRPPGWQARSTAVCHEARRCRRCRRLSIRGHSRRPPAPAVARTGTRWAGWEAGRGAAAAAARGGRAGPATAEGSVPVTAGWEGRVASASR